METMGSEKGNSLRKPMRRRSHVRRVPQDRVIDMAEARREIAHALHLHRSSSAAASCFMNTESAKLGNNWNFDYANPIFGGSQYCYTILESMPLPEPTWSTTAPSILAAPAPPAMEAPKFEWGENQALYTWWLGLLKTIDGEYDEEPKHPYGDSRIIFSECEGGSKIGEAAFLGDLSDQSSPDEWLMFLTTGDQGEQ